MENELIKKTHIPFFEPIKLNNESVGQELLEEINKIAKKFKKPTTEFSAKYEILPNPENNGHFLVAEVTYLKGDLENLT